MDYLRNIQTGAIVVVEEESKERNDLIKQRVSGTQPLYEQISEAQVIAQSGDLTSSPQGGGSGGTDQTARDAAAAALASSAQKTANLSDIADAGSARANIHSQVLASVRVVAIGNIASRSGAQTIDGVALIAGDRVLLAGQTTASQNGLWAVATGAWARPSDYATGLAAVRTRQVTVNEGTYAGQMFQTTSSASRVVDTDATSWTVESVATVVPPPEPNRSHRAQTIVDDCQTAWTGATTDSTVFFRGTKSVKLTTSGTAEAIATKTLSPVDFTGSYLRLMLRDDNPRDVALDGQAGAALEVTSDGFATTTARVNLPPGWGETPLGQPAEWQPFVMPMRQGSDQPANTSQGLWYTPSGQAIPDFTAINGIRVRKTAKTPGVGGSTAVINTYIGEVAKVAVPAEAMVSITIDKMTAGHYTLAKPSLAKYGLPATFFPEVSLFETAGVMTWAQAQELQLQGHEVGIYDWYSGTITGDSNFGGATGSVAGVPFSQRSAADVEDGIRRAKAALVVHGLRGHSLAAGQIRKLRGAGAFDLLRRYFSFSNLANRAEWPNYWPPERPHGVMARMWDQSGPDSTTANIKLAIDRAVTNHEWLVLKFHDIAVSGTSGLDINQADFEDILAYLVTKGVKVRTVGQVVSGADGNPGPAGPTGATGAAGSNGTNGTNGTISRVQDEGSNLTQRGNLNFIGAGVTAADNAGTGATDVTITGSAAGAATSSALGLVKIVGTPTDPANPKVRVQESSEALFAAQFPALVAPFDPMLAIGAAIQSASQATLCRVVCPRTGFLRDISIYVTATSGNLDLGVYDTGDASAGNRTRLWHSGSVAVGAANAWQTIDPGAGVIPVTIGQQLDFAVAVDNAVAGFTRSQLPTAAMSQLPAGFMVAAGGASPKLGGAVNTAFPLPATIAEASVASVTSIRCIIARVSPT